MTHPAHGHLCKLMRRWYWAGCVILVLWHHETRHTGNFQRMGYLMLHHLASATIQVANLIIIIDIQLRTANELQAKTIYLTYFLCWGKFPKQSSKELRVSQLAAATLWSGSVLFTRFRKFKSLSTSSWCQPLVAWFKDWQLSNIYPHYSPCPYYSHLFQVISLYQPILAEWNFPLLSIGPVHFCFKGCWVVFFIGIQILKETSVGKPWRTWSSGQSGFALFVNVPQKGP